jgi:hypothetical protein
MKKIDFRKIKTYPISQRNNKVSIEQFTDLEEWKKSGKIEDLFPKILKGNDLREVVKAILEAKKLGKPVLWSMGAHVIKCGLSPLLIDLMKEGLVSGIAMNGAGAIHDYEIAMIGMTSEDVAEEIQEGRFGMVEETGANMAAGLVKRLEGETGLGEAWGRDVLDNDYPHKGFSLMAEGIKNHIPVTVHPAIGTDITHIHPDFDGALLGKGAQNDFRIFTGSVADLGDGGCYLNIGSAVVLPEVFLKAVAVARNIGYPVKNFTSVNMDMIQHYRPRENVTGRPTLNKGKGYSLTGHHEIMIPLLYHLLLGR